MIKTYIKNINMELDTRKSKLENELQNLNNTVENELKELIAKKPEVKKLMENDPNFMMFFEDMKNEIIEKRKKRIEDNLGFLP